MKQIPLTQGMFALVDEADFERANQHKWHARKAGRGYYGARSILLSTGVQTVELLHTFILGIKWVDHRDGNGLNDQRENLRAATSQQNQRAHRRKKLNATSRFRGVCKHSLCDKWVAKIKVGRQQTYLGLFISEEAAARAYDAAAIKFFGDFAAPNFPAPCRE